MGERNAQADIAQPLVVEDFLHEQRVRRNLPASLQRQATLLSVLTDIQTALGRVLKPSPPGCPAEDLWCVLGETDILTVDQQIMVKKLDDPYVLWDTTDCCPGVITSIRNDPKTQSLVSQLLQDRWHIAKHLKAYQVRGGW